MKTAIGCATIFLTLATVTSADAEGCIKGALVGGIAGHFAGHHGVLEAAAGGVIERRGDAAGLSIFPITSHRTA